MSHFLHLDGEEAAKQAIDCLLMDVGIPADLGTRLNELNLGGIFSIDLDGLDDDERALAELGL